MSSDYHVDKASSTWFFSLSDKVQKLSKRISQKKKIIKKEFKDQQFQTILIVQVFQMHIKKVFMSSKNQIGNRDLGCLIYFTFNNNIFDTILKNNLLLF